MHISYAQESNRLDGFGIETDFLAGKIIKHSKKFTAPIPTLSSALDLNFVWQTAGKKKWHQSRHFPIIGLGVTYTDYGSPNVFGKCIGVYPNLQVPIIKGEKIEWTLRVGDGIGYVTKKNQKTNPIDTLNTAIGSHINDFAMIITDLRWHINKNWDMQIGGNFTHISNGDYRQPNLGVNFAGGHVGVRYFPSTSKPIPFIDSNLKPLPKRWLVEMRLGLAYNEARTPGNPEEPTYIASVYASRRWRGKNKYFFGSDYSYHTNNYDDLVYWSKFKGHEADYAWYGAFFAGNEYLIGRLGIVFQVGVYYHQIYLKLDPYYEKIGWNYYIIKKEKGVFKNVFVSGFLKTHAIIAEFAEFGIGAGF